MIRVVDAFEPKTDDEVLLEKAAELGRVFVTNDEGIHEVAVRWIREGRIFPGMVFWKKKHHERMTRGEFVDSFEELAQRESPFEYPIQYIKPKR